MKKLQIFIIIAMPMLLLFSCGNNAEIERLKAQNDSLLGVSQDGEIKIDEYLQAFNEIQQNLNTIKEKENIISEQASGDNLPGEMKDQINQDMGVIYDLMTENKQTIQSLKTKLKNSGGKNSKLEKTIELYTSQLATQDAELAALKTKLENLNIKIDELNTEITDLNSDIDTLKKIGEEQEDIINNQDEKLNTAYYVYGTKKELIEHNVITKGGVFKKIELDDEFDKTYFTKIDIRNTKEIKLNSKKIELMTSHPSSAYEIIETNGNVSAFKIKDVEKFWETSKFLVIVLK